MALKLTNTWGTDKAIIEQKALDKQGDTMTVDLTMQGDLILSSRITDVDGEEAIKLDPDNKRINIYGVPATIIATGTVSVGETDEKKVGLSFKPKAVIITRGNHDTHTAYSDGYCAIALENIPYQVHGRHGGVYNQNFNAVEIVEDGFIVRGVFGDWNGFIGGTFVALG